MVLKTSEVGAVLTQFSGRKSGEALTSYNAEGCKSMVLYLQFPICMVRCVIDHTLRYTPFSVASEILDMAAAILGSCILQPARCM